MSNYISLVYLNYKKDHADSQNCVFAVCIKEFFNTHGIDVLDFKEAPKFMKLLF